MKTALALIALATVACAPKPIQDQTRLQGATACKADGLKDLIGRKRSAEVEAIAKKRSGAGVIRWIAPGQMVTMDFRGDRIDLRTDTDGKIVAVSCG